MAIRFRQQCKTAQAVAEMLEVHDKVRFLAYMLGLTFVPLFPDIVEPVKLFVQPVDTEALMQRYFYPPEPMCHAKVPRSLYPSWETFGSCSCYLSLNYVVGCH